MKKKKKDTYIAGQTIHNRVEVDEDGNQHIVQRIIYEQREFVDGYVDVKLPKKHRLNNGGFITVFQDALFAILTQGNLSKSEMQVLLYVISTAGVDGSIDTDLNTISEHLNIKKPNVSKAIKELVMRNIILRQDNRRYERSPLSMNLTFNYDQLNYRIAYNGKTSEFKKKLNQHPQLSVPGDEKGEWIDISTGECTTEIENKAIGFLAGDDVKEPANR